MEKNNVEAQIQDNKVIYHRYFEAPVELVFEAWTSHDHLSQWWGPDGFTITTHELDFTVGGHWNFIMHGPDGMDFVNKIQFIAIEKPNLIAYKQMGGEESGTDDIKFQTRITFEASGEGTLLRMEQEFPTKEMLEKVAREFGAIEGGKQHLGNLARYLKSQIT